MIDHPLAELPLARRLEAGVADELCAFVDSARRSGAYSEAASIRVGGGAAVWYSPGNVVNGSYGLGMDRDVEKEEVSALIRFFDERGEPARVDVCPHADRSLLRWLAEEGFVATAFEMVLFQALPVAVAEAVQPGVEVRLAETDEDLAVWAELEARGFTDDHPTPEHRVLSHAIALREDSMHFIGYLDGVPSATGMLTMTDGLAMLNGDSTLPSARNHGIQTALLAERLRHASRSGCDMCVIEAAPGGSSYRNQQRAGFRVAYNRVTLELPRDSRE